MTNIHDVPWCKDCGSQLNQVDSRPGKEAWVCPIALREKIDQPSGKRSHTDYWIYEKRTYTDNL